MEEHDPSPDYIKSFNDGYLIAENRPDVSQALTNIDSDNARLIALKAGVKTFDDLKTPSRYPSWLKPVGERDNETIDKSPSKDMDRDH